MVFWGWREAEFGCERITCRCFLDREKQIDEGLREVN